MEWISVKERLPGTKYKKDQYAEWQESQEVLGFSTDGEFFVMTYQKDKKGQYWTTDDGITKNITHWMPLPEPPKNGD